jgi:hypothetical protein
LVAGLHRARFAARFARSRLFLFAFPAWRFLPATALYQRGVNGCVVLLSSHVFFKPKRGSMKTLYIALGAVLAIIIALKLHINIKFLILLLAAAIIYLYRTEVVSYCKNHALPYAQKLGLTNFRGSSPAVKVFYISLAAVPAYIAAIKLHVNLRLVMFFLAAAVLYIAFPPLYEYYQNNALNSGQNSAPESFGASPSITKTQYIALGVILAFIIAFELHIKFVMYPLAGAIFYLYVPLLYVYGKKSALQYAQNGEPDNYFSFLWFAIWFIVTGIFSYMLSHLLADLISSFHWSFFRYLLYAFILLMAGGLGFIGYLQWNSKKIELLGDLRTNFEKQGRLAGFEILFTLLIYFLVKH